ncbi:MAG: hypothetical protein QXG97_02880, partial [Nitrososphaerota archaeon]
IAGMLAIPAATSVYLNPRAVTVSVPMAGPSMSPRATPVVYLLRELDTSWSLDATRLERVSIVVTSKANAAP